MATGLDKTKCLMRKATLYFCLLSLQVIAVAPAFAQDESERISRPVHEEVGGATSKNSAVLNDNVTSNGSASSNDSAINDNTGSNRSTVLNGSARLDGSSMMNAVTGLQPSSDDWLARSTRFGSQLAAWQSKNSVGPTVSVNDAEKNRKQTRDRRPTITVTPAHCPATSDPAFQNPPNWYENLSQEQSMRQFGSQWELWLTAVQNVFRARANELSNTPGVASVHLIIRSDGSIQEISNYTGFERANAGSPVNERTLRNLQRLVVSVGKFPPFPAGSRVGRYHLILDASVGR